MKAVIQRVRWAEVEVDSRVVGRIEIGLLVYLGVGLGDTPDQAARLAAKVATLRIFADEQGKMNRSVQDVRGGVLAVPNFTLLGDARKGRRPSYVAAAPPAAAEGLYQAFVDELERQGVSVASGIFGAHMIIRSAADGPVNLLLEPTGSGTKI